MLHVDLPIDTQSHQNYHLITVGLFFIHKTIGCVHQTRPKKGTSCLFRTHLVITISVMVSGRLGAMSRMEVFFMKHELYVNE